MSYARDHLIPLVDEGLGNSAYLAGLDGGRALKIGYEDLAGQLDGGMAAWQAVGGAPGWAAATRLLQEGA